MPLYRRRPTTVIATHYRDLSHRESVISFCGKWAFYGTGENVNRLTLISKSGPVLAQEGDWIILERDGQGCYPCKPDIFHETYEEA